MCRSDPLLAVAERDIVLTTVHTLHQITPTPSPISKEETDTYSVTTVCVSCPAACSRNQYR